MSKTPLSPAIAGCALALALTLTPAASATTSTGSGDPVTNAAGQTFKVLAHRSGAAQWPENSVEAYLGASQAGYDGIETDISFTSDGVAVMSHFDKLPKRCTSAGSRIHKMTLAKLSTVRCEDLSHAKTVPIPTFAELVPVLQAHLEMSLTLDLKSYTGQSAAGKRSYASRAVNLVKKAGLLSRTRFLTFYWDVSLPTIRKLAPSSYVLAYDSHGFDYDRVRLAAKLGATGYGTEARYTSVNLAQFIASRGLEVVTSTITTIQSQAMAIYYGPKTYWFMTDDPATVADGLTAGTAQLDWSASDEVRVLTKPVTISKTTYRANRSQYPKVLGKAVPASKLAALKTVNLAISVAKGSAKNYVYVAPASAPASSQIKVALPASGGKVLVSVPLGDGGKLRVRTTKKSKLAIAVISYTNQIYS